MRTLLLKLHNPGAAKRAVLDAALDGYGEAYAALFAAVYARREELLHTRRVTANRLAGWVRQEFGALLDGREVQPFRDSLFLDVAMGVLGRLRLEQTMPSLAGKAPNLNGPRPVYFCRYDTRRSWCLLYDPAKNRFWAKLYLMNASHARPVGAAGDPHLLHVGRRGGALKPHGSRATYLVLPLSFGAGQMEVLRQSLTQPEILRTARLIRRGDDYYLAVSVQTGEREPIEPRTSLGVARALDRAVALAVAGPDGVLLQAEQLDCPGGRRPPENELNRLANAIVDRAEQHRAQVVLQNLTHAGDRLSWGEDGDQPHLGCRAYNRLAALLRYKLIDRGLPEPVRVSAVGLFYTCPACGHASRRNRQGRTLFLCVRCGHSAAVETLGSLNLATRLQRYQRSPLKVRVSADAGMVRFENDLLGVAFLRRQEECVGMDVKAMVLDALRDHLAGLDLATLDRRSASVARKLAAAPHGADMIELV